MAEKKHALQTLARGTAQIAFSTQFGDQKWAETARMKGHKSYSATNSPEGSPPSHQKFNTLTKSSSLGTLNDNSSVSYQPGQDGYEVYKPKEVYIYVADYYLPIGLSVYLSIYLSIYLSTFVPVHFLML